MDALNKQHVIVAAVPTPAWSGHSSHNCAPDQLLSVQLYSLQMKLYYVAFLSWTQVSFQLTCAVSSTIRLCQAASLASSACLHTYSDASVSQQNNASAIQCHLPVASLLDSVAIAKHR